MKKVKSVYDFEEGDYLLIRTGKHYKFLEVIIYGNYGRIYLRGYSFYFDKGKLSTIEKSKLSEDKVKYDYHIKYEMGITEIFILTDKEIDYFKNKIMLDFL